MNEKRFEKWKINREKGRTNFMLIYGLLAWGLPMFLVMTFVVNKPESGSMSYGLIALNAIIWALGGLAFGYFTWLTSEKAFQKELALRENA